MSLSIDADDLSDANQSSKDDANWSDDPPTLPLLMLVGLIAAIIIRPWDFIPILASIKPVTLTLLSMMGIMFATGHPVHFLRLPLSRCLLGVWIIMMLGSFNPYSVGGTLDFAVKYVQYLFLFGLIGTLVTTQEVMKRVLRTLSIVGIILGLLALRAKATGQLSSEGRIEGLGQGMLSDPNDLASMLVTILPLACYLALSSKTWLDKGIGLGSIAWLLTGIAVTQSRGGLLATLAVGGFLLVISKVSVPKKVLVAVAVALVGIAALPDEVAQRYASIGSAAQTDESAQSRLAVWTAGAKIFGDHLPVGVGVTNFEVVYGSRYIDRSGAGDIWRSAHNSIVEAAAELGLIGLTCWLCFMFGPIYILWRSRRDSISDLEDLAEAEEEFNDEQDSHDVILERLRSTKDQVFWSEFMMASIIGFLVSAMFLSKAFDISTVIFVGLAIAGHRMMEASQDSTDELISNLQGN